MIYVLLVAAVIVVIAAAAWALTRGRSEPSSADEQPIESAPMTGLEAALAQVKDRSGRPIGERIEAEAEHVDELRVPDDTGPLLRRALDRVTPADHDDGDGGDDDSGDAGSG